MVANRIRGPLGLQAAPVVIDEGTLPRVSMPPPTNLGAGVIPLEAPPTVDNDAKMLAATAYGEGSSKNVFEEMAAISNVLVRQQKGTWLRQRLGIHQGRQNFRLRSARR